MVCTAGDSERSEKRPGQSRVIETIFVAVARDVDGDEGIIAQVMPLLGTMPLVFTKPELVDTVANQLSVLGRKSNETIEIVKYTRESVVRRIQA